jgi:hypothetical protein
VAVSRQRLGLSRREAVSMLSLAALAPQCSRRVAGRRITGSLVGPSAARGHALRDGRLPAMAGGMAEERTDCAIVGGGIAGLSAAWALDRAGLSNFLLLEMESTAGGTSAAQSTPMPAPWGAHYVPVPDEENEPLLALLDEAGAVKSRANGRTEFAEEVLCRDPQERIFIHDRWYEGLFPNRGLDRRRPPAARSLSQAGGRHGGPARRARPTLVRHPQTPFLHRFGAPATGCVEHEGMARPVRISRRTFPLVDRIRLSRRLWS